MIDYDQHLTAFDINSVCDLDILNIFFLFAAFEEIKNFK